MFFETTLPGQTWTDIDFRKIRSFFGGGFRRSAMSAERWMPRRKADRKILCYPPGLQEELSLTTRPLQQSPLFLREKSAAVFDVILFCIWHDMGFGKRRTIKYEEYDIS